VIGCLVEGLGVRPTARAQGIAINSVQAILRDVAPRCRRSHDEKVRHLPTTRIEADEAWAFCHAREANVPKSHKGEWGYGDVWVWTAIDADTKIIPSYMLGRRRTYDAGRFLLDLSERIDHRFQLDTDAHNAYWAAIGIFSDEANGDPGIDYARVVKRFENDAAMRFDYSEGRSHRSRVKSIERAAVCGNPDVGSASTSYVERANLGLRMHNQKLKRSTNGHAKKAVMLGHTLDVYTAYYNFVRPHQALGGKTPAMSCGLTDRRWTTLDLVTLPQGDPTENATVPREDRPKGPGLV
jgi:IS1 family transposase